MGKIPDKEWSRRNQKEVVDDIYDVRYQKPVVSHQMRSINSGFPPLARLASGGWLQVSGFYNFSFLMFSFTSAADFWSAARSVELILSSITFFTPP